MIGGFLNFVDIVTVNPKNCCHLDFIYLYLFSTFLLRLYIGYLKINAAKTSSSIQMIFWLFFHFKPKFEVMKTFSKISVLS